MSLSRISACTAARSCFSTASASGDEAAIASDATSSAKHATKTEVVDIKTWLADRGESRCFRTGLRVPGQGLSDRSHRHRREEIRNLAGTVGERVDVDANLVEKREV